ncbi:MAG: nitroreductase family deazaflavin-dependent oxidoreductase [Anaerolineae bacterium]|jgi:deazaflavin-dependent oxidoreductase (nitroreductase family)|nr:nitroreductase family deazaflavin-dependent oxidoreductase [Anaerolineae bacterium]MBT3712930.1 nitroreductase family deazaflavin-dependent oxidoreductase [Anaerolineae bacterium]MBT4309975.1 nitroreductase family deazaflavin-dependent oxidoreductase [Anaerolineae bacterium]MBT4457041.1 nitroreductase family deazaflavin-dependent oxidoreductase [Anaerolineae bacterium]MBT6059718.1 nitroreductase family deazaflavin-dependent oxidoreductase [Anaerolineae bacterium]
MTNLRKPPKGIQATFSRMPIYFFKMGLGGLFGERFLLLTHIGRNSGEERYVALEVVHIDDENYYIASGFGTKSQWFKNLDHSPQVKFQVKNKRYKTEAKRLSVEGATEILHHYAEAHPRALEQLAKLMGFEYEGSEENIAEMAELLPIFALQYQS